MRQNKFQFFCVIKDIKQIFVNYCFDDVFEHMKYILTITL